MLRLKVCDSRPNINYILLMGEWDMSYISIKLFFSFNFYPSKQKQKKKKHTFFVYMSLWVLCFCYVLLFWSHGICMKWHFIVSIDGRLDLEQGEKLETTKALQVGGDVALQRKECLFSTRRCWGKEGGWALLDQVIIMVWKVLREESAVTERGNSASGEKDCGRQVCLLVRF